MNISEHDPGPDYRTDRVALKIDALIPELQELVKMLRAQVTETTRVLEEQHHDEQ